MYCNFREPIPVSFHFGPPLSSSSCSFPASIYACHAHRVWAVVTRFKYKIHFHFFFLSVFCFFCFLFLLKNSSIRRNRIVVFLAVVVGEFSTLFLVYSRVFRFGFVNTHGKNGAQNERECEGEGEVKRRRIRTRKQNVFVFM